VERNLKDVHRRLDEFEEELAGYYYSAIPFSLTGRESAGRVIGWPDGKRPDGR
jgi:hypothetical protein